MGGGGGAGGAGGVGGRESEGEVKGDRMQERIGGKRGRLNVT